MVATFTKNRKFDKKFKKKNSEKSSKRLIATKLWLKDTFMIPLKIMVDDPNRYQTWLPPLLKIANLTKKLIKIF